MQFVALSANNYATVSRGEGGTSDRGELQKGWRTRGGGGVYIRGENTCGSALVRFARLFRR